MGYCKKYVESYGPWGYLLFRLLVGLMFFLHGWGKLFVKGNALGSLMGVAGLIEILVGLGVFFGFFTRLAAVGGAGLMIVAYFKAHAGNGLSPLANGGELAVMYFAAFLVLFAYGAGKMCLEKQIIHRETF
jgi:putative oxidoreductase